jgi:mono/diheme cytochrome c family protein
MATAFMVFVALKTQGDRRFGVLRYLGWWLVGGALISYAGYRWWEASLPGSARALFLGPTPTLTGLADTRHLLVWALAAVLILGVLILLLAPKLARGLTAVFLALTAFTFFGSYERLREGCRKPFLIHSHLFSNGLLVSDIETINEEGIAARSGWVARGYEDTVAAGRRIFLGECSSCHTIDGYQGIRRVLPTISEVMAVAADDPPGSSERVFRAQCATCHADTTAAEMREILPTPAEIQEDPEMIRDLNTGMIFATVAGLRAMGADYAATAPGSMIDTASMDYPTMPPFVGTDDEAADLVAYLATLTHTKGGER